MVVAVPGQAQPEPAHVILPVESLEAAGEPSQVHSVTMVGILLRWEEEHMRVGQHRLAQQQECIAWAAPVVGG